MRRDMFLGFLALLSLLFATLLGGCGSAKKGGESQPLAQPTQVGSESCINTCHVLTVDVTGDIIAASWSSPLNTHTTDGNVQCESCHGGASQHWGVGPIPFPDPQPAQCEVCHPDFSTFNTTAHNNENQVPDKTFSQFSPPRCTRGGDPQHRPAHSRVFGMSQLEPAVRVQLFRRPDHA